MKPFLTFLLILIEIPCFSQVVLSLPEYNSVYRGYNNMIEVATKTKMDQKFISLSCDRAKLIHHEKNKWGVFPETEKDTLEIIMIHSKTHKVIDRFLFRVKDLPDPILFVGATEVGGKISKLENRLFARYSDTPLRAEFLVLKGALIIENDYRLFEFEGSRLGEDYLEYVKNIPPGRKVKIKAVVIGPDRKERIIVGEYVL
ncbi:hypothetical protein D3C71_592810 [compost metagenome]